jgi:signal transduction histidine kinase
VRIDEAIRRVVEALAPVAQSRDIVLRIEGASALTVDGDRGQLERAFSNVIDNALKFSPAGGTVRIQLGRAREPSGRPNVTVSVLDTGIGIPHDAMPSLFDRFFRASNARDAAVPGSGLGLPIVRNIVEGHGGRVALESVLGEGTTVRITLPLALDAPASGG